MSNTYHNVAVLVHQELQQFKVTGNVDVDVDDVVDRIRRMRPDVDVDLTREMAVRLLRLSIQGGYTEDEVEEEFWSVVADEELAYAEGYTLETEGPEGLTHYPYVPGEYYKHIQQSKPCIFEAQLRAKALETKKTHNVESFTGRSDWLDECDSSLSKALREAWDEYTEFHLSLGCSRSHVLDQWPHHIFSDAH
jgi:hypothetical protein